MRTFINGVPWIQVPIASTRTRNNIEAVEPRTRSRTHDSCTHTHTSNKQEDNILENRTSSVYHRARNLAIIKCAQANVLIQGQNTYAVENLRNKKTRNTHSKHIVRPLLVVPPAPRTQPRWSESVSQRPFYAFVRFDGRYTQDEFTNSHKFSQIKYFG